jgi:acyl-CoA dehydrogenase
MRELVTGYPLSDWQRNMLAELKTYLDKNFPSERDSVSNMTPEWYPDDQYEWYHKFNQQLAKDGWLIPHWPVEYGGNGWSQIDNMLIREEFAYRRIPLANANGLDMLGPVLLMFGTEEQKEKYLPGIANVTTDWCQGFSEPEAGSDLTSLRTTAVRDGDHYVINGSKIWTGHAVHATWIIVLARTLAGSTGSRGISMILVDMSTPGVSKHPIRSSTGAVTFCQEFFADVRVPVENLIGEEHGGWRLSRALLEHERGGVGTAAKLRRRLDDLLDMVELRGLAKPGSKTAIRLGEMVEQVESARALAYEMAESRGDGSGAPPHLASVLKVFCAEISVQMSELACDLLGLEAPGYHPEIGAWSPWEEYLYCWPSVIAGGSNEIQHEIIASRRLGISRT